MVTLVVCCPHCQSESLVRNGKTPDGRQRLLCRACQRRSTQDPRPSGYSEAERALILSAYQERTSLRGLARTFGVARDTVAGWVKKRPPRSRP